MDADPKQKILELVRQRKIIQAFDVALAAHTDLSIPEHQRDNEYKRLVQRLLLVSGGIQWESFSDDDTLAQECLNYLDHREVLSEHDTLISGLLRLIADRRVDWIRSGKWRPIVIDYIREGIDKDAFQKFRKINFDDQNHIVMAALEEAVNNIVRDVQNALHSLTSLSRFSVHQNQLFQSIRRPDGWTLYGPFLPPGFQALMSEAYDRIGEYVRQCESPDVLDHYERAIKHAERLVAELEGFDTHFSRTLAEFIGGKLIAELKDDFKGNKASQPAKVNVHARDKKYPFHTIGAVVQLGLTVENLGPGYANETTLIVLVNDCFESVLDGDCVSPGRLSPGERVNVEIPVRVKSPVTETSIACLVSWKDFDRSQQECDFTFDLVAQQGNVDWEKLVRRNPYSLEPVQSEADLVGRKDVLNRLIGTFDSHTVGSAIVRGQKRVGKTSIAKTLGSELKGRGFIVVYIEQGDYIDPDPRKTVAKLGEQLCKRLVREEPRIRHLALPSFTDALAPLADFLDDVMEVLKDRRIVFILDEFDELPPDLYVRDDLGEALFLSLRSISSRETIGFLLVGGEKMAHVTKYRGSKLNKWSDEQVDYFSRAAEWSDYRELVSRPVSSIMEYSESALERLYYYTSGNPFFTKQLCGHILVSAAERRDCYVTEDEVEVAVGKGAQEMPVYTFQHFWDDGIIDTGDVRLEKITRRQKILVAVALSLENTRRATPDTIKQQSIVQEVPFVDFELREFVNRKVLSQETGTDTLKFTVHLFYRWLQSQGITELISKFPDPSLSMRGIQEQELLRPKPAEIVALTERWGTYKGQPITTDKVRAWLEQFGGSRHQRLMFKLLQGVTFYTQTLLRARMKEIHDIVRHGLSRNLGKEKKPTKYSEILIGYLDGPDKSGAKFARLYADVADVYVDNVVEKSQIVERIEKSDNIQVLLFVDDFVGTGNSACAYLRELTSRLQPVLAQRPVPLKIVFAAVVAFDRGWRAVQDVVQTLPVDVTVHVCENLDDSNRCFSESSRIFTDPVDREAAKELAIQFGKQLEKNTPLGYGGLELAIVFEDNCPNNTLPILRAQSSGQFEWRPLFKRS